MQLQSPSQSPPSSAATKTTVSVLLATLFFSVLFLLSLSSTTSSSSSTRPDPSLFPSSVIFPKTPSDPAPPAVAYFISASKGDSPRILRLLFATYHPRNFYLLHLDGFASQTERNNLALTVQSVPIFEAAQNIDVIGKPDFVYSSGSSPISATLHGASMLLRMSDRWDWFVNLSDGDYPLVSQDGMKFCCHFWFYCFALNIGPNLSFFCDGFFFFLFCGFAYFLHILSFLPGELNFVNHSSYIGWRESRRLKPIIVDPGLYLSEKSVMFFASQKRNLPDAFRLFSGLTSAVLSRKVIESSILGTDNFPRTLMMYLANTPSSFPNDFPTVICNSRQFNKTIINDNLQYANFDWLSKREPRELGSNDFDDMIRSGAVFASQFRFDDPLLDRIDKEILKRNPGKTVPGGWCLGELENDTCSAWGDADILRPGPGAKRLEKRIVDLLSDSKFRSQQCIVE